MHTRTPRGLVAAAALALLAGACTDTPTAAPSGRAPGRVPFLSSTGPALVSNAVRYRDDGGQPATGRSGNAVVEALALLDREGTTTIRLSARHATEGYVGGAIERVQVKAFAPDGTPSFTRSLALDAGEHAQVQLQGLARGDSLQVQANVSGIDPHRVDVVTGTERVKRLPNLHVEFSAVPEAQAGTPVNLLAVVSELNGDVGAATSCELWAGGQLADAAHGVWVDAGDAVTCAFTYTFETAGTYPLEVRASPYGVPDWDPSDNRDTATLVVNGDPPPFYTQAFFEQTSIIDSTAVLDTWTDGLAGLASEYRSSTALSIVNQSAQMFGTMNAAIGGPATIRVSMSSGGLGVHAAEWAYPTDDPLAACMDRVDGRAMLFLCSSGGPGWGSTSFTYAWVAGTVTYHSQGYSRLWDALTGADHYVYHWNDASGAGEPTALAGDDWTIDVRVVTPAGEHVGAQTLQLSRSAPWESVFPYTCQSFDFPEWSYSRTYCSGSMSRMEHVSGFGAG